MIGPLESSLEGYLVAEIELRRGVCWKLSPQGNAGVPDRFAAIPGCRVAVIELKRRGQKARELQLHRLQQAREAGLLAFVVDNRVTIDRAIKDMEATRG